MVSTGKAGAIASIATAILLSISGAQGWPAQFTKWYIDADATAGGNGSATNPFRDIAEAVHSVTTLGDTIFIKNGQYAVTEKLELGEGVSFVGESRGGVVITTSAGLGMELRSTGDGSNCGQILRSFTFTTSDMASGTGIKLQGRHYLTFDDIHFEGFKNSGLTMYAKYTGEDPGVENYLRGIQVRNCTFKDCSHSGSSSYSGALQLGQAYGALVYGNDINGWRDDHGYGIKFGGGGWVANCKIFNNTVNLTPYTITGGWGAPFSIEFFNAHSNTEIYDNTINGCISLVKETGYEGVQVKVHGNRVIMPDVKAKEGIEGNAPRLEIYGNYFENVLNRGAIRTDWGADDHKIHHNIIRGSGIAYGLNPRGFRSENIYFYNNIIDACEEGIRISSTNNPDGVIANACIKNNIIINTKYALRIRESTDDLTFDNVTAGNNCLFNNESQLDAVDNHPAFSWGPNTIEAAPQLNLSGDIPFGYYENPSQEGNMIDAGTTGGLPILDTDFMGQAPEIGAHEWGLPPRSRIMLEAVNKQITEGSGAKDGFLVRRNTSKGAVTVKYSVSGCAEPTDYLANLDGQFEFEDGVDSIMVRVTALDDQVFDGHRTLEITLQENAAYDLLPQHESAWVYLFDRQNLTVDAGFESNEGYQGELNDHDDWTAPEEQEYWYEIVDKPNDDGMALKAGPSGSAKFAVDDAMLGETFDPAGSIVGFSFNVYGGEGEWGWHSMSIQIGNRKSVEFDMRNSRGNSLSYYDGDVKFRGQITRGIPVDFSRKWIRVSGLIDYSTKKYLLYLDDQLQTDSVGGCRHSLRNPAGSADDLYPVFKISPGDIAAPIYIDNIAVQIVGKPDPVDIGNSPSTAKPHTESGFVWHRRGETIIFKVAHRKMSIPRLFVYDLAGKKVTDIVGRLDSDGTTSFVWSNERPFLPGCYIVTAKSGNGMVREKLTIR